MNTLGKRLKELRGELSQSKLVKDFIEQTNTTLTAQSLGRYENGDRKPDSEMLLALAKYYGVSADYLLGLSGVKEINADKKSVCEYTGLSEESIDMLERIKSNISNEDYLLNIINLIIKETKLLALLNAYLLGDDKAKGLFDDSQIGFIDYNGLTLHAEDIRKIIQIEIQEELSRIRLEITQSK